MKNLFGVHQKHDSIVLSFVTLYTTTRYYDDTMQKCCCCPGCAHVVCREQYLWHTINIIAPIIINPSISI